jgi:hypothetical protein
MDKFYSLLVKYNQAELGHDCKDWRSIFTESDPPSYWKELSCILAKFERDVSIYEIGVGAGDIQVLIRNMGFTNVSGIECDSGLVQKANNKIYHFFGQNNTVSFGNYPIKIDRPIILIQVNCVYFDGCLSKEDYLGRIFEFYNNANPKVYLLEVIDASFTEKSNTFPDFVRVSEQDIKMTFPNLKIESILTYEYPKNTSTKRLYIIT